MRVYGIYDALAGDLVHVFLSNNMDTAKRGLIQSMKGNPPPHESYELHELVDVPEKPCTATCIEGLDCAATKYIHRVRILDLYDEVKNEQ